MKISEVTNDLIKMSIGLSDNDSDPLIEIYKKSAISYITGAAGLTAEQLDTHDDLTTAYLCLIGDMFENRSVTVQSGKENPTVAQILALHAMNYL